MAFKQKDIDKLMVDVGRKCCICGQLHTVQVHHIIPLKDGGTDDIENAIVLCPNCHNEVHSSSASGRTTRAYSEEELKGFRRKCIEKGRKEANWKKGNKGWKHDKRLVLFYAQCLDRPAFRTYFHSELSFSDFDQAMEDTLIALNTGYWRIRDGSLIDRGEGKIHLINHDWRIRLDKIVEIIENIRALFHSFLNLDGMIATTRADIDYLMERRFRRDRSMGRRFDELRNEAIEIMNSLLNEIGVAPLKTI